MKPLAILLSICMAFHAYAQKTHEPLKATANLQLTNNGVSLFPNLSLGKPAAIVNIYASKKNVSFEPEFRWALNGKPWAYIFWLRYRLQHKKFTFRTGIHPAYNFAEDVVSFKNQLVNRFITTRYLAGELSPGFRFSEKFHLGIHYLHAGALDNYGARASDFVSVQPSFSNLNLAKKFYLNFNPQVFYLKIEESPGVYVSESTTLNIIDFPVYLSNMMTYKIKSEIPGDDFVWSMGVNFKF